MAERRQTVRYSPLPAPTVVRVHAGPWSFPAIIFNECAGGIGLLVSPNNRLLSSQSVTVERAVHATPQQGRVIHVTGHQENSVLVGVQWE